VELHQIDSIGAEPLQRSMQLSRAGGAVVVFELGRDKGPTAQLGFGEEVADKLSAVP
jgi:hypothetical protein